MDVNENKITENRTAQGEWNRALAWGLVWAVAVYCVMRKDVRIGFWYSLLNIPAAAVGYRVGDAFRKFTAPKYLLTKGAVDAFYRKVFWLIGPQIIAMSVASVALWFLVYAI